MNSDKYSKKTTGATTPIGKSFKGSISITLILLFVIAYTIAFLAVRNLREMGSQKYDQHGF